MMQLRSVHQQGHINHSGGIPNYGRGHNHPVMWDIGNVPIPHYGAVAPTLLRLYGGVKQYQKGRMRLKIFADGTVNPSPPCSQAWF